MAKPQCKFSSYFWETLFLKHVLVLLNPFQLMKTKCLLSSEIVLFSNLYFIVSTLIQLCFLTFLMTPFHVCVEGGHIIEFLPTCTTYLPYCSIHFFVCMLWVCMNGENCFWCGFVITFVTCKAFSHFLILLFMLFFMNCFYLIV